MPAAIAVLGPWLTAAAAAATIGGTAYSVVNSEENSSNNSQQLAQQEKQIQQQQANQQNLQKQEAVLGTQGQAQAQTGGSLTDSGFQSFVDQLSGYPGSGGGSTQPQAASTAAQTPQFSSGAQAQPDISKILAALTGGGDQISGGSNGQQPPAPQSFFELANPIV